MFRILIVSIAIITIATNCRRGKNCHLDYYINNNSNNAIYFNFSSQYPDTIIPSPNPISGGTFKVEKQTKKHESFRDCVEEIFLQNSSKIAIFFIFDANTLETTPWDTVRAKYLILKRYEITLENFRNNNFTITYP